MVVPKAALGRRFVSMPQIPQPAPPALTELLAVTRAILRWSLGITLLAFLVSLGAGPAAAQAAAEYGHAVAAAGASSTKAQPTKNAGIAHLAVRAGEDPEVANRRALEQRAGKDAARLTVKSVPTKALVWIDGKVIGHTPLLLTLAPGNYKIEMEGARMEFAQRQVNLLPQEAREVVLSLEAHYPTHVRLH